MILPNLQIFITPTRHRYIDVKKTTTIRLNIAVSEWQKSKEFNLSQDDQISLKKNKKLIPVTSKTESTHKWIL